ncbi:LysR substrate-binding domain-containing protein [Bosea thiooxidans]|nr:LysR substrate-binding domain-containing protein [Bosea sp. (in: a-proteobacteria)]
MTVNLRHVELFRHIMRLGTLTQAAEMMSVSQPAASKMLNQLEHSTGIILFQRMKGRLKPTRDGELYFAEVQRTWESVDRLERMTRDIRELQFGRLNLGVMPMLAGTLIPPLLTRFCQQHHKTSVKLHSRSSDRIVEWVIAGQIDLGITEHATPHPNVVSRMLARIPNVCAVPEGHRLASLKTIRPEDLDGENFVSIGSPDRRAFVETVFEQAGVLPRMFIDAPMANVASALVANSARVTIRPIPRDGLSAVGPVPGLENYYLMVTHSGATLSPALGAMAADEIVNGTRRPELEGFRPARFFS